jgi:hypothetical protein
MIETASLEQAAVAYVRMTRGRKCMRMSSKPKKKGITEIQAASTQEETGKRSVGNSARDEEIRRRAYEIYLERGGQPGRDLDDWLQAERELKRGVVPEPRVQISDGCIETRPLLNCYDLGDC